MNQIPEKQNQEQYIKYLAAQRQLYTEEKRWIGLWMLFAIIIALLGAGFLPYFTIYAPYLTVVNVLLVFFELAVMPTITKRREQAAKIQELFDCELLEMDWNQTIGRKPKPETISSAWDRHRRQKGEEGIGKLRNWYETPDLGSMPLHQARVACQIENLRWDNWLRREYARWVYAAVFIIIVLLVIIGIPAKWTLWQFLVGPVLLILPVMVMGLKHARHHTKAADRLDDLRECADDLWEDAKKNSNPSEITARSRQLQDQLYHHRSDNHPVFDWFYNLMYDKISRGSK
ncbi:MAG: hypothetical protein JXA78_00030 [Anaerolineales bacterium]|nr:hypothetical protein [Anaerolineales bacterium]